MNRMHPSQAIILPDDGHAAKAASNPLGTTSTAGVIDSRRWKQPHDPTNRRFCRLVRDKPPLAVEATRPDIVALMDSSEALALRICDQPLAPTRLPARSNSAL
jgi:hypothetical protein